MRVAGRRGARPRRSPPIERPALRRGSRERSAACGLALAVVAYVPLLLTQPGRVGADTKAYLYLDPARLLGRAMSMWDPNVGLGTVTHQNIGYLWPMGPCYWLSSASACPTGWPSGCGSGRSCSSAGAGVRYLLRTLRLAGPGVVAATFAYALTPYIARPWRPALGHPAAVRRRCPG